MKCKNCGKELAENAVICTECGQEQERKSVRPFLCKLFRLVSYCLLSVGVFFMVISVVAGVYKTVLLDNSEAVLMLQTDIVGATLGVIFATLALVFGVVGFIFGMTERKKILDRFEDMKQIDVPSENSPNPYANEIQNICNRPVP